MTIFSYLGQHNKNIVLFYVCLRLFRRIVYCIRSLQITYLICWRCKIMDIPVSNITDLDVDEGEHAASILCNLNYMRHQKTHCDFLIKVCGKEIPVHKNILSAGSKYFKAMFAHQTMEHQHGFVEFHGMNVECLVKCVDFIYSGRALSDGINLDQLMHVAHVLQLDKLCDNIAKLLGNKLNSQTFFTAKKIADMYEYQHLADQCDSFALKFFKKLVDVEGFSQLDGEYLFYLTTSDDCRCSESFKCFALIKWINHDIVERKCYYQELVKDLNLFAINSAYIKLLLENDTLFRDAVEKYQTTFNVKALDSVRAKGYNEAVEQLESLIIINRSTKGSHQFNPYKNDWMKLKLAETPESFLTSRSSAVLLEKTIYVLMKNRVGYKLEYMDDKPEWTRISDMEYDHNASPPVTTSSGSIYIVGSGANDSSKLVEKYDPTSNRWTKLNEKKIYCHSNATISVQGFIFSIGGVFPADRSRLKYVEKYNPITSEWNLVAPMHCGRSRFAVVEWDRKIYALGGWKELSVEFYNVSSNIWTMAKPLPACRYSFSAFVMNDNIYTVGGINNSSLVIEKLDTEKDSWESVSIPHDLDLDILGAVKQH